MKLSVSKNFSSFVDSQEDYSPRQKEEILNLFRQPVVRRIFMLSLYLLIWSLIGIVLDALFVGGGVLTAIMMQHVMLAFFLPAIVYFTVNTLAKFVFIKAYMKKDIGLRIAAFATLPYIGSAILFGALLQKHPEFLKALHRYIKHMRKKGFVATCKLCFQSSNEAAAET